MGRREEVVNFCARLLFVVRDHLRVTACENKSTRSRSWRNSKEKKSKHGGRREGEIEPVKTLGIFDALQSGALVCCCSGSSSTPWLNAHHQWLPPQWPTSACALSLENSFFFSFPLPILFFSRSVTEVSNDSSFSSSSSRQSRAKLMGFHQSRRVLSFSFSLCCLSLSLCLPTQQRRRRRRRNITPPHPPTFTRLAAAAAVDRVRSVLDTTAKRERERERGLSTALIDYQTERSLTWLTPSASPLCVCALCARTLCHTAQQWKRANKRRERELLWKFQPFFFIFFLFFLLHYRHRGGGGGCHPAGVFYFIFMMEWNGLDWPQWRTSSALSAALSSFMCAPFSCKKRKETGGGDGCGGGAVLPLSLQSIERARTSLLIGEEQRNELWASHTHE